MNKIIIPAAALAMGVALVGSVSSTLAWYQYSTKAQAAYIGTSVGQSENLEIKKADGSWASNLSSTDVDALINLQANVGTNMSPITPAINTNLAANAALPANFFNSVETGVAGYDTYGNRYATKANYVEFTLNVRYKTTNYKIDPSVSTQDGYPTKLLKLVDLTIVDDAGAANAEKDLYKAVRVHFSTESNKSLFASDKQSSEQNIETNTFGKLDTDNANGLDKGWVYEWDQDSAAEIVYGANNTVQASYNANAIDHTNGHLIGTIPASEENGLAIKVTIWLEGWQKLSGVPAGNAEAASTSAMWDPAVYARKHFKVGMRFQAADVQ